jgi:hypothetical protein
MVLGLRRLNGEKHGLSRAKNCFCVFLLESESLVAPQLRACAVIYIHHTFLKGLENENGNFNNLACGAAWYGPDRNGYPGQFKRFSS